MGGETKEVKVKDHASDAEDSDREPSDSCRNDDGTFRPRSKGHNVSRASTWVAYVLLFIGQPLGLLGLLGHLSLVDPRFFVMYSFCLFHGIHHIYLRRYVQGMG